MSEVQTLLTNVKRIAGGDCQVGDLHRVLSSFSKLFIRGEDLSVSDIHAFNAAAPDYPNFLINLIANAASISDRNSDQAARRLLHDFATGCNKDFIYSTEKRRVAQIVLDETIKAVDTLHRQRKLGDGNLSLTYMVRFAQTSKTLPIAANYVQRSVSRFLPPSSLDKIPAADVAEYATVYTIAVQSFFSYKRTLERRADPEAKVMLGLLSMPVQRLMTKAEQNLELFILDLIGKDSPQEAYKLATSLTLEGPEINPFYSKATEMAGLIINTFPDRGLVGYTSKRGRVANQVERWSLMLL